MSIRINHIATQTTPPIDDQAPKNPTEKKVSSANRAPIGWEVVYDIGRVASLVRETG